MCPSTNLLCTIPAAPPHLYCLVRTAFICTAFFCTAWSVLQGALLTSGYSYLYALALVPVGLLADKVDRPKLLAVGLALWSTLSIISSGAGSFGQLLVARTGFAVAQAAQNPVSFSLIPDLFPNNKSTALAGYNCAIYLGRALSFASVLAAHRVRSGGGATVPSPVGTMADAAAGAAGSDGVQLSMVPLDKLDLQRMSIIYTTGDMAAVTPLYNYNFHVIAYESAAGSDGGWRELLRWIGYPGFAIALLMALTVAEPRHKEDQQGPPGAAFPTDPVSTVKANTARLSMQLFNVFTGHGWHHSKDSDKDSSSSSSGGVSSISEGVEDVQLMGPACVVDPLPSSSPAAVAVSAAGGGAATAALALPGSSTADAAQPDASSGTDAVQPGTAAAAAVQAQGAAAALMEPIKGLLSIKSFQATTIAAALNDLGSYALIAWHSTFYERVFGLDSGVYAPMLAVILPVGGILGGVGGGLIADYLSVVGGRYWLTAGAGMRGDNRSLC
jgi:MFS family permease